MSEDPRFPDPRPLRRIQAATAALIGVVALITLLSDSRPSEVRWGTLVGLAALVVAAALILRRRGRRSGDDEEPGAGPGPKPPIHR